MDKKLKLYCKECGDLLDWEEKEGAIFVSRCSVCDEDKEETINDLRDKINDMEDNY